MRRENTREGNTREKEGNTRQEEKTQVRMEI